MQKSPWFRQSWLLSQWFMHSLAELTNASMGGDGDGGGDGTSVVHLLPMHLLQEVPSLHVESTEQSLPQKSDEGRTAMSDCRTASRRTRPQEERIRSENRTDLIIRSNLT